MQPETFGTGGHSGQEQDGHQARIPLSLPLDVIRQVRELEEDALDNHPEKQREPRVVAGTEALDRTGDEREEVQSGQISGYKKVGRMKGLKPLIAIMFPTVNLPVAAIFIQGVLASIFAYYESMDMAMQYLVAGIGIHLTTSLACVICIPAKRGERHFKQEVVVKGLALLITAYFGSRPELQISIKGVSVSFGAFVAGYFLLGEWLGICQDADTLNAKLFPPWFKSFLQRAKDGADSADVGDKLFTAFTVLTSKKVGNTETVSKTETVVSTTTTPPDKP